MCLPRHYPGRMGSVGHDNVESDRTRQVHPQYLFMVGTTKGGTSSLHLWLNQHPDIALSRRKELHFFCSCPAPHLRAASTYEEYLTHLTTNVPVTGESSPCYLYYPETPQHIYQRFPSARILVSLRDPVERYWSHYLMNDIYRPTGLDAITVLDRCLEQGRSDALNDLFGLGLYCEQLQRYMSVFGPPRMKVIFLEELESDAEATLTSVFDFLELPTVQVDTRVRDKQYVEPRGTVGQIALRNPTIRKIGVRLSPSPLRRFLRTKVLGAPEKPPIPAELSSRLAELYREESRQLEELLGRRVPWRWHTV